MRQALALFLILLISGAAMSVRLGPGPIRSWHEAVTLRTAQETWLRIHDAVPGAWIVPYFHDDVRINKPPMVVWLILLSWTGESPASISADPEQPMRLLLRARFVSVGLALVAVLGAFLAGRAVSDARGGLIAAGMLGTLPFLHGFARMPTYDIGLLAGATMAVGCGLTAMTPFSTAPRRGRAPTAVAWGGFAVSLAFAWMCKGPLALLIVAFGCAPAIVVCAGRRWRNLAALGIASAVAAAIVLPWYLALAAQVDDVVSRLGSEYSGPDFDYRPPWYYLYHINWTMPWTVLVLGGLAHPFMGWRGDARRQRLIVWMWFAIVILFFSIVPQKVPRYILPAVPAMMLIAACVWRDRWRSQEESAGAHHRDDRAVIMLHWIACMLASFAIVAFAVAAPWVIERQWLDPEDVHLPAQSAAILIGLALSAAAIAGFFASRHRDVAAAWSIAFLWSAAIGALGSFIGEGQRAVRELDAWRMRAAAIDALAGERPLAMLGDPQTLRDRSEMFFLLNRRVPPVSMRDLRGRETGAAVAAEYIIATDPRDAERLRESGFDIVLDASAFSPMPHRVLQRTP